MAFTFDVERTAEAMAAAIVASLKKDLPLAQDYATVESRKIAATIAHIGELYVARKIDKTTTRLLLDMQEHASRAVLLTIEGLGVVAAEKAINAALAVVAQAVNKAIGFALL